MLGGDARRFRPDPSLVYGLGLLRIRAPNGVDAPPEPWPTAGLSRQEVDPMVRDLVRFRKGGEAGHMLPTTIALCSLLIAFGMVAMAFLRARGVM